MSDFQKGVVVMAGFIGQALSSLFKENEDLISSARNLGGVAACRIHRVEEATNLRTGERTYRWQIEFQTQEDAQTFSDSVSVMIDAAMEEGR
jgi:hypothetical protein